MQQAKTGVLVVDDDRLVRTMVRLGLERHGLKVWSAPNGGEAVDIYQENREHIGTALLDRPATLDALRMINGELPVCFVGEKGKYDKHDLMKRGATCVISKPLVLDELATILQDLAMRNCRPGDSLCRASTAS
jgi:CheY-like chemotaxis protein